ncbi:MAG: glutamine synthetase III [Candidatus Omnitrophica bacterium]|nr:glutamine synthetase III [Candidatus Omnitrophota bacterium]
MGKVTSFFGELTFNKEVMKERLCKPVYEKLISIIEQGEPLDNSIAGDVAHAMKEWAIDNGATHFTHWFQPQRGGTAEKHDSFLTYDDGLIVEHFSASQLIQSEPDASSFPSGGMRSTFEARGYTAWDPTSPAFLLEGEKSKTLVIPSVFLSWTGDVLDIKTPFLRSMRALNDSVMTLQKLLGNRAAKRVKVYGGPEQEYFLFSKDLVKTRPDLEVCGRTLFGTAPAKGQQMEDHYFGSIKEKVLNFMEDLDFELYRRGIPSKTRHNEVSPNQFEVAPLYQEANLAIDNNLQVMTIMQKVADKHGLVAVLHEKPLAGVNGSGKHFNWSIGDNTGENYLSPSKSPLKNINFLVTVGAILLGVKKYGGILRASVADAGNDHRLGANEAPPAIMSVYLGEYLDNLLNEIEGIGKLTQKKMDDINTGVRNLPKLAKDTSDRNRTSPIAFTGNKFEFRAVGSSHNCAEPGTVLNLIVAYGYDEICRRIKANKGADKKTVAIEVLKDVIKETKAVRFEGNNYSDEWHKEAEKRGLINRTNTPSAIELFLDKEVAKLYEKYNVLTEQELHSKVDIKLEAYIKTKEIEYKTAIDIAQTGVLASLALDISRKAKAAKRLKEVAGENAVLTKHIAELSKVYSQISKGIDVLKAALKTCESEKDILKQAHSYAEKGGKALEELRAAVDEAETMISKDLWTMASYQDLLLKL